MATYWKISALSAYDLFSKYKYLIVILVFSYLGFWRRNFFLIAPFPEPIFVLEVLRITICERKRYRIPWMR